MIEKIEINHTFLDLWLQNLISVGNERSQRLGSRNGKENTFSKGIQIKGSLQCLHLSVAIKWPRAKLCHSQYENLESTLLGGTIQRQGILALDVEHLLVVPSSVHFTLMPGIHH